MTLTVLERFWSKVEFSQYCWTWTRSKDRDGYGLFGLAKGRTVRAHRYTYGLAHDLPLDGFSQLDHLCRNRACVRPSHLEPVTSKINNERGQKAQQTACIHGHKFTEENTYMKPNGTRSCRTCHSEREKEPPARARRAEAARRYRQRRKS